MNKLNRVASSIPITQGTTSMLELEARALDAKAGAISARLSAGVAPAIEAALRSQLTEIREEVDELRAQAR